MATTVGEIVKVLKAWAPLSLKESWDNPGLLIGSPDEPVDKLMVTLDVMMGTVDYAIEHGIQMIVSHHPVIFDGLKSLRTDTYTAACTKNSWPTTFPSTAPIPTWIVPTAASTTSWPASWA